LIWFFGLVVVWALVLFLCLVFPAEAANKKRYPDNFSLLVAQATPAVVNICYKAGDTGLGPPGWIPWEPRKSPQDEPEGVPEFFRFFDELLKQRPTPGQSTQNDQLKSIGSGVLVDQKGFVITFAKSLPASDNIWVRRQGKKALPTRLIGKDPETGLVLLKIKSDQVFPCLAMGSSDALNPGDWVLACGNPLGGGLMVTAGIVSAKGRTLPGKLYLDYIETDARINSGNIGGPLLNLKGEVVGINILPEAPKRGNGFALSVEQVAFVFNQLKSKGKVVRGWLGASVEPLPPRLAKSFAIQRMKGVLVQEVRLGSPAKKGGMRKGDVIMRYDGHIVESPRDFALKVAASEIGRRVVVTCLRENEKLDLKMKIAARPGSLETTHTPGYVEARLGLILSKVTGELIKKFDLPIEQGLMVVRLDAYGPAARAGVLRGDIICEASRRETADVPDLEKILREIKPGQGVMLKVNRGNEFFDLFLDLP
jgi:serine protease Do